MTQTPWAGELCFPRPSRTVWWDGAGAMWTSFSRGGGIRWLGAFSYPAAPGASVIEQTMSDDPILDAAHVRLDNLRGRSCFAPPAQAAELFVRQHTGNTKADSITLSAFEEIAPKNWRAGFTLAGQSYSITVEQVPAGYGTYGSCADDHPKPIEEFRLITIT